LDGYLREHFLVEEQAAAVLFKPLPWVEARGQAEKEEDGRSIK